MEIGSLLITADASVSGAEKGLDRLGFKYDQTVKRFRDGNGAFVSAANVQKMLEGQMDKTARSATNLGDNFGKLDSRLKQSLSGMLSMAGISLSVVGALGLIISEGTRTQDSLNTLKAVTHATGEEMARVSALARDLGNDISLPGTSAADAADAMVELAKGGLTLQQAMDAARGTIQLARAATIGEAQAATIAADALNTFGLAGTQATRVADLLAGASIAASGEVTDMAQALAQAGAVARGAKVSLEETVTTISLLAKNGIKGSDAGTSLKTFLLALQTPVSNEAVEALSRLKIEAYDANKAFKPLPQLIADFSQRLEGLNDQDKADVLRKIFGADAIRAARIIFGEGAAGFAAMETAVTRSGQAAEIAAAKSQGLSGAWDALKSTVQTLAIDIFGLVSGPLTGLLNAIGAHPGLFAAAAIAVGGLAAAHALYNSQLLITAATRIPMMLASLRNLVTVMFSFSQVTALSGTALASFALGWAGIIAAIGIGVVALVDWSSATDRANAITVESINNLAAQANQFSQMKQEASELASKQSLNTEEHKKLEAILSTLNPTTRAYIGTLGTEKEKIDEVKKAIDDLANRSETELKASLVTLSQAISKTNDQISEKERRIRIVNRIMDEWKEKSRTGTITQQELKNVVDSFSAEIAAAGDKINKELNPQLLSLSEKFSLNTNALHFTREQLIAFLKESGNSADQIKIVIAQYDAWAAKNNQVTGALNQTTAATNAQAEALANLQNIMNRFNARDQNITARVMSIVDQAKNKGEAVRMAREAMRGDSGFRADVQGSLADKSEKEAVERALGLSGGGGGGGGRRRGGGGGGGTKKKSGEQEAKELLASLTKESGGLAEALKHVDASSKVVSVIIELLDQKYKGLTLSTRQAIMAEAALVDQRNAQKSALDLLRQSSQQAADSLFELQNAGAGGLTDLQKFDYALSKIPASARPAQTEIDKVRAELEKLDQAKAGAEARKKLLDLDKALRELSASGGNSLRSFGLDVSTEMGKAIQSISQLSGINVPLDRFTPLFALFDELRNMPEVDRLETLGAVLDRIFITRPLGVDEGTWRDWREQIEQTINSAIKLDQTILGSQASTQLKQTIDELNGKYRENNELTEEARVRAETLTGALKNLSDAQKQQAIEAAKAADTRKKNNEDEEEAKRKIEELKRKAQDVAEQITGTFQRGLREGWRGVLSSFKELLENMALEWLKSKIYRIILEIKGHPQQSSSQQQGGQTANPLDGLGDLFGSVIRNISGGKNDSAGAVRSAGEEMSGAIANAGGKSALEVERTGQETTRSLSTIGKELTSGLAGIASIIAASNTRGSFWSGLFMAAASGAINGALGKFFSPSSGGGSSTPPNGAGPLFSPGGVGFFASGGLITGAGTGTSDSIHALLSNREFVVKASSVASLGEPLLNYLNEYGSLPKFSPPRFAAGGSAYMPPVRRASASAHSFSQFSSDESEGKDRSPVVNVYLKPDRDGRIRSRSQVEVEMYSRGSQSARRNG